MRERVREEDKERGARVEGRGERGAKTEGEREREGGANWRVG